MRAPPPAPIATIAIKFLSRQVRNKAGPFERECMLGLFTLCCSMIHRAPSLVRIK